MLQHMVDAIFWKRAWKRQCRINDFWAAIHQNNIAGVRQMLAAGMDPNQVFQADGRPNGERPLHVAAASPTTGYEIIDALIAAGANPLFCIHQPCLADLSPSGFAQLMRHAEKASYLKKIEDEHIQRIIASGRKPPIISQEPTLLGPWRQCSLSRRTKPSKGPSRD